MQKKSVLFIGNFLSGTNTGTHKPSEDLAQELAASGWKVFTASSLTNRLSKVLNMLIAVLQGNYVVAHVDVYSGSAFCWAEAVGWILGRLGKPFILTLRGGNLPAFSCRWPGRVRRLLQSATIVTTPSNYLKKEMEPYCNKLKLMPNPLYSKAYRFRPRTLPQARLIWLRAFRSMYNPQLAPKVLGLLATEFPQIKLIMVGPDKGDGSRQQTQEVAKKAGVLDCINFLGHVPKNEVPYWLNQGDIFLNTTYIDNTPVSVLEAMVCGLCVVSTSVGGISYLLTDKQDSLLVPPNDPIAMALAVRRILKEPTLAAKLSQNARRKAEEFDWSVILPQWEALLTAVAEGRRT
jgi:glycosyltransferase involved in cell wall biosynthesis